MDAEQQEIYEALGISPPEQQPATETQPGTEQPPEGGAATGQETQPPNTEQPPEDNEPPKPQTEQPEEREREIRDAVAAEMERFFRDSGLVNPFTDTPITNRAEYEAYRKSMTESKRAEILTKTGMNERELNEIIDSVPEVATAKAAQEAQRQAAARDRMAADLAEIGRYDPNVKQVSDILNGPRGERFYDYVRRGNGYLDAYRLTFFDQITQREAEAKKAAAASAEQAARNARGKEHLIPATARGDGAPTVPGTIREMYRQIDPEATEEEIQKHYARYLAQA